MTCFDGDSHKFQKVMERPDSQVPTAFQVVRWCEKCGGVVVDYDMDGRTLAGGMTPFMVPDVIDILRSRINQLEGSLREMIEDRHDPHTTSYRQKRLAKAKAVLQGNKR